MEKLKEKLRKKGWTKREVNKTISIIQRVRASKPKKLLAVEKAVYWAAFIVVVFGNFIISIALLLFMLLMNTFTLFLIVAVLGVSFGFLAEILMRDISYLQKNHHILFGIVIPLVAIFNAFIITTVSNGIQLFVEAANKHNPLLVGIVYAGAFISPYLYYTFLKKN